MISKSEMLDARHAAIVRQAEPYEKMIDEAIKKQYPERGMTEITKSDFKTAKLDALFASTYESEVIDYLTQRYTENGGWRFVYSYDNDDGPNIKIYPA